ncbi:head-tail connector protein [Roseomonas chloroacetimidivorans]|uniref:head-tail connector protein n=1 Tax=Roseomonas chloroacetimidivorans TaxID=1766656 RepID=UPI003C780840
MITSLQVVTPPASEPVSVALARKHCRVDHPDDDDLLGIYITAARTWAESYTGRAIVPRQLRWTVANERPAGAWPYVGVGANLFILPQWAPQGLFVGNARSLELPVRPVLSVDEVSFGQWGREDEVLDAATYGTDLNTGRVHFTSSFGPPNDHLSVLFTAGYGAGQAAPQAIIHGILLLTGFLYEHRGDAGGEMPPAAAALLGMYRLTTFGG